MEGEQPVSVRMMEQSRPAGRRTASDGENAKERRNEDAVESESGTVRTNDVETYYVRRGNGPPIVFIHSLFMSASQWEPQMEALGEEYTTIAYDVRGHGHTGGSDVESYSVELYAADLDALLAALDVEKPILCGLSMGGCIAQVYAATYPEKVAGLVLSDTFPPAPLPLKGRFFLTNLRFFGLLDRVVKYTTLNRIQLWVGERFVPGIAGDGVTTQRLMEEAPTIPHAEFVKIARSMAAYPEVDIDTARIDVPTLVMHGENVPTVFRAMNREPADRLPNADVEVTAVPDAGHASNVDNPEFFSAAVREFVARIAP